MERYRFTSHLSEVRNASKSSSPSDALRKSCEIQTLQKVTNVLIGHETEILQIFIGPYLCVLKSDIRIILFHVTAVGLGTYCLWTQGVRLYKDKRVQQILSQICAYSLIKCCQLKFLK